MAEPEKKDRGPYRTFFRLISRYFSDYGGWRGLLLSPFLHVGILIAAASYSVWTTPRWSDIVTGIIPNLLGFSLGTYALLFSLMSTRMKQALKHLRNQAGKPYLDEINATFFHFIVIQALSLMWAILMKSSLVYDLAVAASAPDIVLDAVDLANHAAGFIGYVLLNYSLALVIASSIAVYRLARIVDPSTS